MRVAFLNEAYNNYIECMYVTQLNFYTQTHTHSQTYKHTQTNMK